MIIKGVEIDNHPILGNVVYNFEEEKSITLLVSENGSGKTKLMQFIYDLLDKGFRVWEIPEWLSNNTTMIKLSLQLNDDECLLLPKIIIEKEGFESEEKTINGDIYFEVINKEINYDFLKVYSFDEETGTYLQLPREFSVSLQKEKVFAKILREKVRFSSVEINYEEPKVERAGAFN
ncbi:MAG: hypothetical protein K2X69_04605, partial [Silvanigrellaceae bacterium]|nr:hypothetical protein [Silvanigrellaceae bacterium]